MKKKVVAFVGVTLAVLGLYVNQAQGASAQENYDRAVVNACDSAKDLAYNIMIIRQMPVTEDDQIQMIKDVGIQPLAEKKAIEIVKIAHTRPAAYSNMVESVSVQFGYEIQDKCLSEMTGKIL